MCPEVDSESEYQGFPLGLRRPVRLAAETSGKSGALSYPEPLGSTRPVAGDPYLYLMNVSHKIFTSIVEIDINILYYYYLFKHAPLPM